MIDTEKIEKEFRDALNEVLIRNGVDLYANISIDRKTQTIRGSEAKGIRHNLSENPVHDIVFEIFTICVRFPQPAEKSP